MRTGSPVSTVDGAGLQTLLEDVVFAEWATETAGRYHVSVLETMGAQAEALAREGMSRQTASTETAELLAPHLSTRLAQRPVGQRSSTSAA